jgi:chloramphenicol O-acetyltransferase type A
VEHGTKTDMAMTLEVHHALVDGAHIGAYFAAVQTALDSI